MINLDYRFLENDRNIQYGNHQLTNYLNTTSVKKIIVKNSKTSFLAKQSMTTDNCFTNPK